MACVFCDLDSIAALCCSLGTLPPLLTRGSSRRSHCSGMCVCYATTVMFEQPSFCLQLQCALVAESWFWLCVDLLTSLTSTLQQSCAVLAPNNGLSAVELCWLVHTRVNRKTSQVLWLVSYCPRWLCSTQQQHYNLTAACQTMPFQPTRRAYPTWASTATVLAYVSVTKTNWTSSSMRDFLNPSTNTFV